MKWSTVIRETLEVPQGALAAGFALIGWGVRTGSRDEAAERGLKSWTEEAAQRVIGPAGILLDSGRLAAPPAGGPVPQHSQR